MMYSTHTPMPPRPFLSVDVAVVKATSHFINGPFEDCQLNY